MPKLNNNSLIQKFVLNANIKIKTIDILIPVFKYVYLLASKKLIPNKPKIESFIIIY